MINIERISVWGWEHALRGMRNPLNSWDKADSTFTYTLDGQCFPKIGNNDLKLMKRLFNAGTEHRKYLRMIFVSFDITAPLYWWKEFDTYKVGTAANSCSTMHKIAAKDFELSDFSHEHLDEVGINVLKNTIEELNNYREIYNNFPAYQKSFKPRTKKDFWWCMIQLLPISYNQKRTVTMNYENVVTILKQRTGHKLDEWNNLCSILLKLPYVTELMDETPEEKDNA